MTRDRWIGVVALFGMFGLGVGFGLWMATHGADGGESVSAPMSMVVSHAGQVREADGPAIAHDAARAHHEAALEDLRESVGLDDAQIEQVHAVFARHQSIVQDAWQAVQPQIEIAMEKVHREIAELLRPDQRVRYHDWLVARRGGEDPHGDTTADSHP